MKKTGQLLREAREKKGLTIAEIAHVTKINPKTLEALEKGDVDQLPQRAFIRGFVQTYAKYLGLDVNETLKSFQDEMGQTKPELPIGDTAANMAIASSNEVPQVRLHRSSGEFSEDLGGKSRTWLIAIASLVLILLIGFVVQMIQKYEKESELHKESIALTKIDTAANTTSNGDLAVLTGSTNTSDENNLAASASTLSTTTSTLKEPETTSTSLAPTTTTSTTSRSTTTLASISMTTKPTSTSRSTTTSTLKPTTTSTLKPTTTSTLKPATTSTLKPTTTSSTLRQTTTTTSILKPTTTTLKPTTSTTLSEQKPKKQIEVIIEALDNVTLGYRTDNSGFLTIKLAPEQFHTFKANTSINIDVSDGGAVNVIVNGQDRGAPGSLGQPIKLKYP